MTKKLNINQELYEKNKRVLTNLTATASVTSSTTPNVAVSIDNETGIANFNFQLPKGEQGIQGNKGDTGEAGVQGPPGPAITLKIGSVNSIPPIDDEHFGAATAVLTQMPSEENTYYLSLGLPAGLRGQKGETGAQGARGPKGDKGDQGNAGTSSAEGGSLNNLSINTVGSGAYVSDISWDSNNKYLVQTKTDMSNGSVYQAFVTDSTGHSVWQNTLTSLPLTSTQENWLVRGKALKTLEQYFSTANNWYSISNGEIVRS